MRTWKLPDPPGPEVDVLTDRTGRSFYRMITVPGTEDHWISTGLGPGRGTYSWVDLLLQRGPVTSDDQ